MTNEERARIKRRRTHMKFRQIEREASAMRKAAGIGKIVTISNERFRQDIEARMAEIPVDTRDLTSRMFGDPLPGRSALDRMSAA